MQPLKSRGERDGLSTAGGYHQLALFPLLPSERKERGKKSLPRRLWRTIISSRSRISVEGIFSLFLFAHWVLWFNSAHRAGLRREERGRNLHLSLSISVPACLLQGAAELLFLPLRNEILGFDFMPVEPTTCRQIEGNSSVVGCVKEVGTKTNSWLRNKRESYL